MFPVLFNNLAGAILAAVRTAKNTIRNVAGYGFLLTGSETNKLNKLIQTYKFNGGVPQLLHLANYSVNYNLLYNTNFENNTTGWSGYANGGASIPAQVSIDNGRLKVVPQSTYTWAGVSQVSVSIVAGESYVLSGEVEGSQASWNLHFLLDSHSGSIVRSNTNQSFSFAFTAVSTVTTTLYFRTNTSSLAYFLLDNLQLTEVKTGITIPLTYRARTANTAVKSLNIGSIGASGDFSFVAGTPANMLTTNTQTGLSYNFNSTLSQAFDTTINQYTTAVTFMTWMKKSTDGNYQFFAGNGSGAMGFWVTSTNRFAISRSYQSDFFIGSNFTVPNNVWQHIAFTYNAATNTFNIYQNGVLVESTVSSQTWTPRLLQIGNNANGSYPNWVQDNISYANTVLAQAQISNIFNSQRNRFGI